MKVICKGELWFPVQHLHWGVVILRENGAAEVRVLFALQKEAIEWKDKYFPATGVVVQLTTDVKTDE